MGSDATVSSPIYVGYICGIHNREFVMLKIPQTTGCPECWPNQLAPAPKTYEMGLREAFEAACKAECSDCEDGISAYKIDHIERGQWPYHHTPTIYCRSFRIRRAAKELGINLSAAPDAEKGQ